VRTAGEPITLADAIRREVQRIEPDLPIYDVQTMEQRIGTATARTRMTGILLAFFAAVALLLELVGIYGVVAGAVAQRTHEIGVRLAVGALRPDIATLILRHGAALAALGLALGVPAAWSTTRVLSSLLYEVEPADPVVFASVAIATALVTLAASAVPALRAARVDPLIALKAE
jgi:putative ABC transport system permease protein